MGFSLSSAFIPALLISIGVVSATQRCNAVNFLQNGVWPCTIKAWSSRTMMNMPSNDTLSPNVSSIVFGVLQKLNMSASMIDDHLNHHFSSNQSHLFAKIVETIATIEPYAVYAVADLIRGFNLTANETARLNLPNLSNKVTALQNLYAKYFCQTCSNITHPLKECVAKWAMSNCDKNMDGLEAIHEFVDHFSSYYCEMNRTKLTNWLDNSLGSVLAPVARYFGVVKDPSCPKVITLSNSSLLHQKASKEKLEKHFMYNCHYLWSSSQKKSLLTKSSQVGVGHVFEELLEFGEKLLYCSMRTLMEFDPQFFSAHNQTVQHLRFLIGRYGLEEIPWRPSSFSKNRDTAAVIGGNHVYSFDHHTVQTCPRVADCPYNMTTLLSNRFFTLSVGSTSVDGMSYISKIVLNLTRDNCTSTVYYSGSGVITRKFHINPPSVASLAQLQILPMGVIRIIDRVSGTVFVFTKYSNSYLVFVRAGEEVQEQSVGLVESGCFQPINIRNSVAGNPGKRARCQKACSSSPKELVDNCIYDCYAMNDINFVNLYKRIKDLNLAASANDREIQASLM